MDVKKLRYLKFFLVMQLLVLLFHMMVLLKVIPYSIVWAGKLKNDSQMIGFELVSMGINLLIIMVLLFKAQYIKNNLPVALINGILWVFAALFALNTIGNLTATTLFEKIVFTPLTLLSTILLVIILKKERTA